MIPRDSQQAPLPCRSEQWQILVLLLQTNRSDAEITPVLGMRFRDPRMFFLRGRQNKRKPAKEIEKKKIQEYQKEGRCGKE